MNSNTKKDDAYVGENNKLFEFNKRIVIRRDEDGAPYLIRRTLFSLGSLFSIKYHQILLSDETCSHDHPWPFLTFILKGGYYEWTPIEYWRRGKIHDRQIAQDGVIEIKQWHGAGSVLYRPASWRHRLELRQLEARFRVNENNGNLFIQQISEDKLQIAHTLVFTGKVIRDWGFFTKKGWIFWRKYSKTNYCE